MISSALSDRLGRPFFLKLSIIKMLIGSILIIFSWNLALTAIGFIVVAYAFDVLYTLSFVLSSEISPVKFRNKYANIMLTFYFFGEMVGSLLGLVFYHYQNLTVFFALMILPSICFTFKVKPSFYELLRKRKKEEFSELANYVSTTNGVPLHEVKEKLKKLNKQNGNISTEDVSKETKNKNILPTPNPSKKSEKIDKIETSDILPFFDVKQEHKPDEISLTKYFKKGANFVKLIAFCFLIMNCYWVIGNSFFLPEIIGFKSIVLNNFFLAFADFVGILLMFFFINRGKRNTLNKCQLILIFLFSTILVVLNKFNEKDVKWIKVLDIIFSCKILLFLALCYGLKRVIFRRC